MRLKRCYVLLLVLAAGCGDLPVQGAGDPSAIAEPIYSTGNAYGPIKATLSGPEAPQLDRPIALTLRIDRQLLASSAEVSIRLSPPEQVQLQRGALYTRVLPDSEPITELHYVIRANGLPDEDLIAFVDAVGEGFGYHARLPYRFGRRRASPKPPRRGAGVVSVGGRSFGAPVQVLPSR